MALQICYGFYPYLNSILIHFFYLLPVSVTLHSVIIFLSSSHLFLLSLVFILILIIQCLILTFLIFICSLHLQNQGFTPMRFSYPASFNLFLCLLVLKKNLFDLMSLNPITGLYTFHFYTTLHTFCLTLLPHF